MISVTWIVVATALLWVPACLTQNLVTKLGSFKVPSPAFVTLYENKNATKAKDRYDFLVSSFTASPFSKDSAQITLGIGNYMDAVFSTKCQEITGHTTWPNEVSGVPEDVFGKRMVAIPDGFILPFKTDGSIRLMDVSSDPPLGPYLITDDSRGQWFYHRVRWHDMDGDGDLDAVTCHAREPIFGTKASELLWLDNPGGDYTKPWKQNVIIEGPDIFFEYVVLNTTDGPFHCVVTSQFFTRKLAIYWTTDENGLWTDNSKVQSRVIDDTIGAVFEVKLADVNNDGKLDLLVTNNGNNGSLFVYEIPDDFRTGAFKRHVISTGYVPVHSEKGNGAPGSPLAVVVVENKKPVILLSGDDNGNVYALVPMTMATDDWRYQQTNFAQNGGTMGQLACADVDGDGSLEIFVPSYSTSEVFVFRLNMTP